MNRISGQVLMWRMARIILGSALVIMIAVVRSWLKFRAVLAADGTQTRFADAIRNLSALKDG